MFCVGRLGQLSTCEDVRIGLCLLRFGWGQPTLHLVTEKLYGIIYMEVDVASLLYGAAGELL